MPREASTSTKTTDSKSPLSEKFNTFANAVDSFRAKWIEKQKQFAHSLSINEDVAHSLSSAFDMKEPEQHGAIFAEFSRIFSDVTTEDFDAMTSAWYSAARHSLKNPPARKSADRTALLGNGMIFASFLLFNGELYCALRVTSELIVMGEKSIHLFLCCLILCIELREFELYKVVRKLNRSKSLVPSALYWLEAMDLLVEAQTAGADELKSLVKKTWSLIRSIMKIKVTFASCYAEVTARQVLIFAAKSPLMDSGDPLCHFQRCYELSGSALKAIAPSIFEKQMVHLFDGMPDNLFEKIFHIHCGITTHIQQAYESLDCGIVAETECRLLRILTNGIWMAYPFAIMHSLNIFALIKWMTVSRVDHTTQVFSWLQHLQKIKFCHAHKLEHRVSELIIAGLSGEGFRDFFKFINEQMIPQWKLERDIKALDGVEPKKSWPLTPYAASYLLRISSQMYYRTKMGYRILRQQWVPAKQVVQTIFTVCAKYINSSRAQWLLLRHLIRIDEFTNLSTDELRDSVGTPIRSALRMPVTPGRTFTKSPSKNRKTPSVNKSEAALDLEDKENNHDYERQLKFDVVGAYEDLKQFAHLLYIDWRRQISGYLATNVQTALGTIRPLHVATFLADSMAVSLRAETRMRATERQEAARILKWKAGLPKPAKSMEAALSGLTLEDAVEPFEDLPLGYFGCSEDMKRFIKSIPSYLTVIQLSFDSRDNLWLTRFHRDRDPYSIQLSSIINQGFISGPMDRGDPMLVQFFDLLVRNDQSTRQHQDDPKQFWVLRRSLNEEMAELVERMEKKWLGPLWPLVVPFNAATVEPEGALWVKTSHMVRAKLQHLGLSPDAAFLLTHLLDHIPEASDWSAAMIAIGGFEGADIEGKLTELKITPDSLYDQLKRRMATGRAERMSGESYVFMALPSTLAAVPWECMNAFTDILVSRIPSIFTMDALMNKHLTVPKPVNARNSYYVLNPESNLQKTQERLEAKISSWKWEGVSGKVPDRKEIIKALGCNDLYVYAGHGSGRRYIGTANDVRRLECRSVCLLMGCSSVEIIQEGRGWDGRSTVYELLTAHCPAVIGFLWMVTDGDADRFFIALMEICFEAVERGDLDYRCIMRGMAKARKACKLNMLTGSAAVCYGLPIFTHFDEEPKDSAVEKTVVKKPTRKI